MSQPIVITTKKTKGKAAARKRAVVFSIDGTDYTAPETFTAAEALRFIELAETRSPDAANIALLQFALGLDGYRAMLECEAMTAEDLAGIITAVRTRLLGAMELPKAS